MTTHRPRYPVIAAVVLALIGLALLTHHPHTDSTETATAPTPSPTSTPTLAHLGRHPDTGATPSASSAPTPANHGIDTETPAARATWAPVAYGFARTFATPTPTRTWHARIQVWVTPHLAAQFATADPRLLDPTRVRSIVATTQAATLVACTIRYADGQIIRVTIEASPTGWFISTAQADGRSRH